MKVLIVDDDRFINEMVSGYFENKGHEVGRAFDGQEGVDLYLSQDFDLVIVDLFMPEKDGFDTIEEIRQHDSDIPIIAASGMGEKDTPAYERAIACGAARVFEKPFTLSSLYEASQQLVVTGDGRD